MTKIELTLRVCEVLEELKDGEIRIPVRNGEAKYINVLKEYIPKNPRDRGKLPSKKS